jgi:hypothetical protein
MLACLGCAGVAGDFGIGLCSASREESSYEPGLLSTPSLLSKYDDERLDPVPCGAIQAANVLASNQAVEMGIYVVRAFVHLREALSANAEVSKRLAELEMKTESLELSHDTFSRNTRLQLRQLLDAVRELTTPPEPAKRPIGFVPHQDKKNLPSKPAGKRSNIKAKASGKKA